ncbi:hypothetical protein [Pseudomonas putida]
MSDLDQQAASGSVVHSSLMSFLPDVSQEAREDILLANAFAQQVAWSDFNDGLETDWFRNYWRNLAALGFDGKLAPGIRRPGPDRQSLADQAVAQINQAGAPAQAQIAQQSLQALNNDSQALRVFESHAVVKQRGRFQLLPCAQQANGFIDMVLLHMELELEQSTEGFLFAASNREHELIDLRVEVIHFNLQGFRSDYRQRAEARIDKCNKSTISELKLQGSR